MKFLFAFATIAIVLTVVYGATDPWNDYKTKHGKKYSATEDAKRKQLFLATDAIITKHNSQKNATFKLAHNTFSDKTAAELNQFYGEAKPANRTRSLESQITIDMADRELPTSLDYRNSTCLPPVKNQGQCGSCWAFAAIAPLEFAQCKKSGSPVVLSEQQLVDCDPYDAGCSGGWTTNAWFYLRYVAGGSAKSSSYPYTATKNNCTLTTSMIGSTISTYSELETLNATNMQAALTSGPIKVSINAIKTFSQYTSGIYNDVACSNVATTNHAVVAVGYGTEYGIDYWIVRNSWGPNWGMSGYIKMQRGVNLCNIEKYPAAITSVV